MCTKHRQNRRELHFTNSLMYRIPSNYLEITQSRDDFPSKLPTKYYMVKLSETICPSRLH